MRLLSRMLRTPMTQKQQNIYDYIVEQAKTLGFQPTVRDVARRFGIALGTAQDHIAAIRRKGWLVRHAYLHKRANIIPGNQNSA